MTSISVLAWVLLLVTMVTTIQDTSNSTLEWELRRMELQESSEPSHALSRRKRFLTFPDGSSFQLVFCVQNSALIPIGDIFLFGNTAALAWELPKDPHMFYMLKGDKEALRRRGDDAKNIYYTDNKGKVLFKVPYKRRKLASPAVARRSVGDPVQISNSNSDFQDESLKTETPYAPETEFKIDRKQMHASQQKREFLKREHMSESSVEFHRLSRTELYGKLEVFLRALGLNGRECLLRALCETGARRDEKQSGIVTELLRTVFTLPKGREFEVEHHREYDIAHGYKNSTKCQEIYPECHGSLRIGPVFL